MLIWDPMAGPLALPEPLRVSPNPLHAPLKASGALMTGCDGQSLSTTQTPCRGRARSTVQASDASLREAKSRAAQGCWSAGYRDVLIRACRRAY